MTKRGWWKRLFVSLQQEGQPNDTGKKDIIPDEKKGLRNYLTLTPIELFNHQIERVAAMGCDDFEIISALRTHQDPVMAALSEKGIYKNQPLNLSDNSYPFFPVIPTLCLGLTGLQLKMKHIDFDGHPALTPFFPAQPQNIVEMPNEPYYVLNIGANRLPEEESKKIGPGWRQRSNPLSFDEIVACLIHVNYTSFLEKYKDACGRIVIGVWGSHVLSKMMIDILIGKNKIIVRKLPRPYPTRDTVFCQRRIHIPAASKVILGKYMVTYEGSARGDLWGFHFPHVKEVFCARNDSEAEKYALDRYGYKVKRLIHVETERNVKIGFYVWNTDTGERKRLK